MKYIHTIIKASTLCLVLLTGMSLSAQESGILNIEDCSNYNNFLESEQQMDSIWNYVTEIRPGGRMIFKPDTITSQAEYTHFLSFLNLDSNVTFQFVKEHPNRHFPEQSFLRYQQHINDIPIEGGGIVVSGIFAPGTGPDGPGGPCSGIMMMVPHVANDVNLNLNPTLSRHQAFALYDTLGTSSQTSLTMVAANLVITSNKNKDCNYHLAWKITYLNEFNSERFVYLDAHNGDVLLSGNNFDENLPAQTDHYGERTLINLQENDSTWLISPDERIKVYHHTRLVNCDYYPRHYIEDSIPSTDDQFTWGNTTSTGAYQAFFVAQTVLPFLDEINVEFDTVNLMVGCTQSNAFNYYSHTESSLNKSYTMYGIDSNDLSIATFNSVCHELGHGYIHEFLSSADLEQASLHEGIADMFGIFCDWRFTSNLNWQYGYQNSTPSLPRDLSDPLQDCFSDIKNLDKYEIGRHERGTPLSHLFFLLVEGGASYDAPILPLEIALQIILDGLPEVDKFSADYPQLMDATINQVIENYGYCSDEFIALVKAWEKICVSTDFPIKILGRKTIKVTDCEYFLYGTPEVCWTSENAEICFNIPDSIDHGINPAHNTWTITGPGSADFESSGGMSGNQQQGGMCLNITSIPELAYYPRVNNIRLDFSTNEGSYSINHRLLVYDCTGTKPDCQAYHGQRVVEGEEENERESGDEGDSLDENYSSMEVYDLLGRLLYQGHVLDINTLNLPLNQVLLIRYLDEKGQVKKTHKTMKIR